MEAKYVEKEDFPLSELTAEGMKVLEIPEKNDYSDMLLNVPYAKKDGVELHLEIILPPGICIADWLPQKPTERFPAVVYCVGSGWRKQDMGRLISRMERFCKRGYVAALVEYRHSGIAPFPAQIKDMRSAIRFLRNHAEDFVIDPNYLYIWGDSSGGHTVTMVNVTEDDDPKYSDESELLNIKACVDFFGPSDLTRMNSVPSTMDHMSEESPSGMLLGRKKVMENLELAEYANPINHLTKDKKICPQLIFHGNRDRVVPFEQSVLLYEKMRETGQNVEFYQLKGSDHCEDAFYTEEIFEIIDQFFKSNR